MDKKAQNRIIARLRQEFKWSDDYKIVKKNAMDYMLYLDIREEVYICNGCGLRCAQKEYMEGLYNNVIVSKVAVDHIEPVIPVTGMPTIRYPEKIGNQSVKWLTIPDFNAIIERMFCGVGGLQVLCTCCHYLKTQVENQERKEHKDARKKL